MSFLRGRRRRRKDESPYQLGIDALIAGDREGAMKHLADAVRLDPRNIDAYVKLGNLLRERGHIRQAIQVHRELLVKRKLTRSVRSEITKNLAMDLAQAENWADVIGSIKALPRAERSDPRVLLLARDAYEALGEYERAVSIHKELLKTGATGEPTLGTYRAHVAFLAHAKGDNMGARAEFRAALKDDPGIVVANLYLGDIAASEEDRERAIAYWMKIVTDKPECAHLVFDRLEKAFFDAGDYGRLMGIYEDVVSRVPSSVHAIIGLSRMLERKGTIDEAIRLAREAIKHEGDTLVGHRHLIELLVRSERHEEAAKAAASLLAQRAGGGGPSCPSCGGALEKPAWRCPAFRAWVHVC